MEQAAGAQCPGRPGVHQGCGVLAEDWKVGRDDVRGSEGRPPPGLWHRPSLRALPCPSITLPPWSLLKLIFIACKTKLKQKSRPDDPGCEARWLHCSPRGFQTPQPSLSPVYSELLLPRVQPAPRPGRLAQLLGPASPPIPARSMPSGVSVLTYPKRPQCLLNQSGLSPLSAPRLCLNLP